MYLQIRTEFTTELSQGKAKQRAAYNACACNERGTFLFLSLSPSRPLPPPSLSSSPSLPLSLSFPLFFSFSFSPAVSHALPSRLKLTAVAASCLPCCFRGPYVSARRNKLAIFALLIIMRIICPSTVRRWSALARNQVPDKGRARFHRGRRRSRPPRLRSIATTVTYIRRWQHFCPPPCRDC